MEQHLEIEINKRSGRALFIDQEERIYISDGYSIYVSNDGGFTWLFDCKIPNYNIYAYSSRINKLARLTRSQIQSLIITKNKSRIVIARDGIYRACKGEKILRKTFQISRGSRPININKDDDDRIFFGEYGSNRERHEIHIYRSDDDGISFSPAFTFQKGDIRHVHNVKYDYHLDQYWVFTGDYETEPGIGILSKDFKNYEWVNRGEQKFRAVDAVINKDSIIYGMDSEKEKNYIVRMDKKNGDTVLLNEIEGSSMYAATFGNLNIITTMVEPSSVNKSSSSYIYGSNNCEDWKPIASHKKDRWHPVYFQYGNIVLPKSESRNPTFIFSGQALRKVDNRISFGRYMNKPETNINAKKIDL